MINLRGLIKVREGTTDSDIIKEIKPTYGWLLQGLSPQDETVLDIGGNIGCYSRYAWEQGARKIYCYEPEESNFNLLRENVSGTSIKIFNQALMSNPESEKVDFFIPKNEKNMGGCSLTIQGGRRKVSVKTKRFSDVLEALRPSIIKMDCEGAEYDLLLNTPLPDCVKRVCIELHLGKKEWRYNLAPQVIGLFKDWEQVKPHKITDVNWHTILRFQRN